MKARHRGYEIEVTREPSMTGDVLLFYSIFREADGWEALSGFEDSDHTVPELVGHMKARIDNELAEDDPWLEKAGVLA